MHMTGMEQFNLPSKRSGLPATSGNTNVTSEQMGSDTRTISTTKSSMRKSPQSPASI